MGVGSERSDVCCWLWGWRKRPLAKGCTWPLGARQGKGMGSPPGFRKGCDPADTMIFAQWHSCWTSNPQYCKVINLCCLKSLSLWQLDGSSKKWSKGAQQVTGALIQRALFCLRCESKGQHLATAAARCPAIAFICVLQAALVWGGERMAAPKTSRPSVWAVPYKCFRFIAWSFCPFLKINLFCFTVFIYIKHCMFHLFNPLICFTLWHFWGVFPVPFFFFDI